MELRFLGCIAEGYDQEFLTCKVFPSTDEVEVYVLEWGGLVDVMDLGHDGIGVVFKGVVDRVMA